jgi:hypothetical protein
LLPTTQHEDVRPYTRPLVRSIAAPIGRLMPSRSGPFIAPQPNFGQRDNMNDRANPYSGALGASAPPPFPFGEGGCDYGAIPSFHNARATGAPSEPRTSRGQAYITPPGLWNLSGIAGGFIQVLKAPVNTVKLATGHWTPMQSSAPRPLPSNPEPARMLIPRLP